jgi:phage regulator Rha-like protein
MSKDNLVFNSKKCPGSVTVYHEGKGICIITVNKNAGNQSMKIDDRFVIPVLYDNNELRQKLNKIKPGTYREVKSAVIEAVNNSNTKG